MDSLMTYLISSVAGATGNLLSEKLKGKLPDSKYQELLKYIDEKDDKHLNIFLESHKELKKDLLELQKKSELNKCGQTNNIKNNSGPIAETIGTINYYNNTHPPKNYEDNYQKAIRAMGVGEYTKAENLLHDFIKNVDDIKDGKLLLIACELSNKRIDKLHSSLVDRYFQIINNHFRNNYLGLVILGILYIDYFSAKNRKPPSSISLEGILKDLEISIDINDYSFALKSIAMSEKAKQKLKL